MIINKANSSIDLWRKKISSHIIYSWVAGKKHYNLQPHKLSRVKEHKLEHPLHCVVEKKCMNEKIIERCSYICTGCYKLLMS